MSENYRPFRCDWRERFECPDKVLRSKILKKREILIMLGIARHWPTMRPSYDKLAEECNVSRQTVKRAIATLKRYGVIKVIDQGGYNHRANVYMVYDSPEMWEAETEEEFMAACKAAQQKYANEIVYQQKKESPASVGADAGEGAGAKNNNVVDSYCTTIDDVCQSVMKGFSWANQSDCKKMVNLAQKVIQEDEIVGYLQFCSEKMECQEKKGKIIKNKLGYALKIIKDSPEEYRNSGGGKPEIMNTQPKYDPMYDDAEWLYAKFHGKEDGN